MADPTDEIERIRALLAEAGRCGCDAPGAHGLRTAHIATLLAALDTKSAEVERLREKNRELNRRAQTASSEAHKDFVREWLAGGDYTTAFRIARLLGVDPMGKSFATLADETEAAMRERLGEVEQLRTERDQARRAAIEEAIAAAEAWEYERARNPLAVAWAEGAESARAAIVADLRALLDGADAT